MKNSKKSSLHLLVQNRETGEIDGIIRTKEQYNYWLNYILGMNDIQIAMNVFHEELGCSPEEVKNTWSLVEIVNVMSTRYKIIDMNRLKEEK